MFENLNLEGSTGLDRHRGPPNTQFRKSIFATPKSRLLSLLRSDALPVVTGCPQERSNILAITRRTDQPSFWDQTVLLEAANIYANNYSVFIAGDIAMQHTNLSRFRVVGPYLPNLHRIMDGYVDRGDRIYWILARAGHRLINLSGTPTIKSKSSFSGSWDTERARSTAVALTSWIIRLVYIAEKTKNTCQRTLNLKGRVSSH
ncbi:hypothetical protein DFH07DRAFT_766739 [Mycena maculata]|uniref:Uncharacterized protein n=1 Tax=Mycena maculata TaxID=230809 RepID=A0AAD7K224_9AGAR|nr:hypothetical protein DFH07DRAFT_766739 [Mycena maculata]